MTEIMGNLKTDGFLTAQYPQDLREDVEVASRDWRKFCEELSPDEKMQYSNLGEMSGYEIKRGEKGKTADYKENFDLSTSDIGRLDIKNSPKFIGSMSKVLDTLFKHIVTDVAPHIEEDYHMPGLTERISKHGSLTGRGLHYFPGLRVGTVIGELHTDGSYVGIHLDEDRKGCQGQNRATREFFEMPVASNSMVMFPGIQFQYLSEGNVPALMHRIVVNEETSNMGRYAMVAFLRLEDTPHFDKKKFGRLQDFAKECHIPDVPHKVLKTMFTSD